MDSIVQRGEADVARYLGNVAVVLRRVKRRDALHEGASSSVEKHAKDLGVGATLAKLHRAHVEVAGCGRVRVTGGHGQGESWS